MPTHAGVNVTYIVHILKDRLLLCTFHLFRPNRRNRIRTFIDLPPSRNVDETQLLLYSPTRWIDLEPSSRQLTWMISDVGMT